MIEPKKIARDGRFIVTPTWLMPPSVSFTSDQADAVIEGLKKAHELGRKEFQSDLLDMLGASPKGHDHD